MARKRRGTGRARSRGAPSRPREPAAQLTLFEPEAEPIRVRESTRARRMTIHVSPHLGVEVVVPKRTPARDVQRFVSDHLEWIEETEEELAHSAPPFDRRLPGEIRLAALDEKWRVLYRRTDRPGMYLRENTGVLELSGAIEQEAACRDRLRQWLAERARTALVPWLARLSERSGLEYRAVQIRGQRTRWGSCSTQRTISLNYSLLFLASPLVRYLLIHELAHTRHMSHGTRFWALVEKLEPEARRLDAELGEAWREVPGWVTWLG